MTSIAHTDDILVIEDDHDASDSIRRVLERDNYHVRIASSGQSALRDVLQCPPLVALLDLGLPDVDGVDLIRHLFDAGTQFVIVVSGTNSPRQTRLCLRNGADDFIRKPVERQELLNAVQRVTSLYRATDVREHEYPLRIKPGFGALETPSQKGQSLFRHIKKVAQQQYTHALITGEPGMFKRDIAALLHQQSQRTGPALLINCAIENDDGSKERFALLNEKKSAPSHSYFYKAKDGALVLDDLSRLSPDLQESIIRHIEMSLSADPDVELREQSYCTIIGILKEPAQTALDEGRLRPRLYDLLSDTIIRVPSLSQRPEDNRWFAEHAVRQLNTLLGTEKKLSDELALFLQQGQWQGNLVELKNQLLHAYRATENDEEITIDPVIWQAEKPGCLPAQLNQMNPLIGVTLQDIEMRFIKATLAANNNNKTKAAKALGISVKTLYNRLAHCD